MTDAEKSLVIVESPAKARTIGKYLGRGYEVAASVGHVRDLPPKELGVDVERGFEPKYVTIRGKGKIISELKQKAKKADRVILATDPDREGEAIAYHVAEQLGYEKDRDRFQRVTFREVTKGAVQEALRHPGPLDLKKIEAQQARRILDRLVGYQVSPLLWKPIRPGLSAGRVQTVALRLICEREDEIRAFEQKEYWSITAHLEKDAVGFQAKLHHIDGASFTLADETGATEVLRDLSGIPFEVTEVKRSERRKNPAAPFTTSTLQQEAAKSLRFSARRTMSTAQRLYEGQEIGGRGQVGLITYMRTDSTRVSPVAVAQAREWIGREFGNDFVPTAPNLYGGGNAPASQDAHEAIRPTDVTIHPSEAARYLEPDQARLYELVWLRFVASQMPPAVYDTTTIDFDLRGASGKRYLFRTTGSILKFAGFTKLYEEAIEAGDVRAFDDMDPLPELASGDVSTLKSLEPKQHFTQPPPRFSEASLVKELERLGIGRPSTYATIISVIVDRGYVELEQRRFRPTDLGEVVAKLLVRIFPDVFDVEFTSQMESDLDRVEEGEVDWHELLGNFYPKFVARLKAGEADSDEIIKEILAAEGEVCEKCGRPMLVRWNRFGRFLGCSGYPECQSTRSLDGFDPEGQELGPHPTLARDVRLKYGPYGPYVEMDLGGEEKPKRVSLPNGVEPKDVDLGVAVKLLELPRAVGPDPKTGEEIVAGLGRFGPFVRRGKIFASLQTADALWSVTPAEASELIEAKLSGRRVALKELGKHPTTGADLTVHAGRYGPYVTDGTVNATLPKDTEPEDLDLETAVQLIDEKAAKGGGRGRRGAAGRKAGGKPAPKAKAGRKPAGKSGRGKKKS
jgi:DNA topoisomerase-1